MTEIGNIHIPFCAWLNRERIPFLNSRPDKKATIKKGWPDFSMFLHGRSLLIECKLPKGKIRDDQEIVHGELRLAGNVVNICRSAEDCIAVTTKWRDQVMENLMGVDTPSMAEKLAGGHPERKGAVSGELRVCLWNNSQCVFEFKAGGETNLIRQATLSDIQNLPKGAAK